MTEINQALKVCPSCRSMLPIDRMGKVVSRSWGKTTKTLRCYGCIEKIAAANEARKLRGQT